MKANPNNFIIMIVTYDRRVFMGIGLSKPLAMGALCAAIRRGYDPESAYSERLLRTVIDRQNPEIWHEGKNVLTLYVHPPVSIC